MNRAWMYLAVAPASGDGGAGYSVGLEALEHEIQGSPR